MGDVLVFKDLTLHKSSTAQVCRSEIESPAIHFTAKKTARS